MSFNEKTFYQAVCDKCGAKDEDGEFQWWYDRGQAVENVTEYADWFERTRLVKTTPPDDSFPFERRVYETVELICTDCKACEVCGIKPAYVGEEENHLVCDEHEDHVFEVQA